MNLHNAVTVSQQRLGKRVAQLSSAQMNEVCAALRFSLGCDANSLARPSERGTPRNKFPACLQFGCAPFENRERCGSLSGGSACIKNQRWGQPPTGAFIARHEDALFLGPPGTGKSHLAQAIGQAAIQQGYRVLYRETHTLLDELAEASIDGTRKECLKFLETVPLLIIDDLGMRKLPLTAAEELLEVVMRRYERASTLLTSNRPVEDWGKLLGDAAAVSAMLDRLLHHGHLLKCGPRSWRTKTVQTEAGLNQ